MFQGHILLVFLLVGAFSADFNISAVSICTNVSAQGYCLAWKQSGTVVEDYGSCFPAHAEVMTPQGLTRMDELKKGDLVLGFKEGKEIFSEVTSWFHLNRQATSEYLKISAGESHFEVSPKHNIAVDDLSFKFADELEGSSLFGLGQINSIQNVQGLGLYSPKTKLNNYFVYLSNSPSQKILAHCFAHIRHPERYELPFRSIESIWDLLFSDSQADVHPSYDWMRKTFTFIQE